MTPTHAPGDLTERGALTSRAALLSVAVATLLGLVKLWAVWRTGSTAMLGSLADTTLDLVASVITLIGVRIAAIPADEDHRFGHGKAEALVGMVQVVLISISALFLGWRAVNRLIEGGSVGAPEAGIAVSVLAIFTTLGLIAYQTRVVKRTASVAIATDSLHYRSDLLLNVAVIAALALETWGGLTGADGVFGVLIALWLLWGAWRAASEVVDQLMDKEWSTERKRAFIEVALKEPEARGIHHLRTRTSGTHDFVQLHLWLPHDMTVAAAHEVMDRDEARLHAAVPGVNILIHPDPEGHVDTIDYEPSEGYLHGPARMAG